MRGFSLILLYFLAISPLLAQQFVRRSFDYSQMENIEMVQCSPAIDQAILEIDNLIETNQSEAALAKSTLLFEGADKCPSLFSFQAWSLFRNGKWMEACTVIDSGIATYGADPDLILRRGNINLEMAELGLGVQYLDGNALYLPENKQLPYDEEGFKQTCYEAGLQDFKYLADTYEERDWELYVTGYIYQNLGQYENSNSYFTKIPATNEFFDDANLMRVKNYTLMEEFVSAENILKKLEEKYPKESRIMVEFVKFYEATGQNENKSLYHEKAEFYEFAPVYCGLDYTPQMKEKIEYFLDNNSPSRKIKTLKKIVKKEPENADGMLMAVLILHANHGNGVEEEAAKLLATMGSKVVPKIIQLMQSPRSTCTITHAASILAEIKDPAGWQPMVDMLPQVATLPITLIPPPLPEKLIEFDRQKALPEILKVVREYFLPEEKDNSDDPIKELGGLFTTGIFIAPLKTYSAAEIKTACSQLGFSADQTEKTLQKVFPEGEK